MEKRQALTAKLEPFVKREVKYLEAFVFQGGKWYKLQRGKDGSIRILPKVS